MPNRLDDDLESLVTIDFGRELSSDKLELLFSHICKYLGCRTSYQKVQHARINEHGDISQDTLKFEGTIFLVAPLASATFTTYNGRDFAKVKGIRFVTPPSYEVNDLNPQDVELMQKIKKETGSYV